MASHLTEEAIRRIAAILSGELNGELPESSRDVKHLIQILVAVKRRPAISYGQLEHLDGCKSCRKRVVDQMLASHGGGVEVRKRAESLIESVLSRLYEGELIRRAQVGEKPALERLVERHYKELFRFCVRVCRRYVGVEARDVAQETWRSVLRSLEVFDTERGTSFRGYLRVAAANMAKSQARQCWKRRKLAEEFSAQIRAQLGTSEQPADPDAEGARLAAVVTACAKVLGYREQQVLFRQAFLGESYDEIGKAYGKGREWVRGMLARARKKVRGELKR